MYLKGRWEERQIFHALVHFSNGFNSQGWSRPNPGAQNPSKSSTWLVGAQVLRPSSATSQAHWQEARSETVVRTRYRVWGTPSCDFTCCTTTPILAIQFLTLIYVEIFENCVPPKVQVYETTEYIDFMLT